MLNSIKFSNFKAHENLNISFNSFNILVGPNNSGKSTILDALRIFAGAYRFASRYRPSLVQVNGKTVYGYYIPETSIPISIKHVHTDYNEEPTTLEYKFKGKKSIFIVFSYQSEPILYFEGETKPIRTAVSFRKEFPLNLAVIPTLGPLEEVEESHNEDYVKRWSSSHRAPRLFRNVWYYDNEQFEIFKELVEKTWTGISIELPERESMMDRTLNMFCVENRMTREIFWAGNGFQIWLQLLTHIIKAQEADFIIIDEPEIYLHPDLQRKLITILRALNVNVILATHSIEIINEVEPDEVLIVQKNKRHARRLTDLVGLQNAVDILGSTQNIHLTRLARGKKVLFVEGQDSKFLEKFSNKLGLSLFNKGDLTVIPIGGFSKWEKISHAQWTFTGVLGENISIAALFDRDYRNVEEINKFEDKLNKKISFVHVLKKKEIENYLIVPKAIEKAILIQLRKRQANGGLEEIPNVDINSLLHQVTEQFKEYVSGQLISNEYNFIKEKGKDLASVIAEQSKEFERSWNSLEYRLSIVSGKELFSSINKYIQKEWKVSISPLLVLGSISKNEINIELVEFFEKLQEFVNGGNMVTL